MNIINSVSIFEYGDQNKIPVIFVHGFPFDHNMWNKITDKLRDEFYCITYDIRGLGLSEPGDGQFTMEDLVDDLFSVVDKFNLKKPVLCGLSMGGYIALRAIEKMEFRFGGLILCDTKSASDPDEAKIKRAEGIKKINTGGIQKYIAEFVPNCFAEESIEKLGQEYIGILGNSMNMNPVGVKGCLLAMAARTDTTNYLPDINIPTLVLCGEKDKFTPPPVMKDMADKIKNSISYTVPGVGHMSPVENPEYVYGKINEFLKTKIQLK